MAVTPFDEDLDVQDAGARETRAAELDHEFDRLDEALAAGRIDPARHFAGYEHLFAERAAGSTLEDELDEADRLDRWYQEADDY